MDDAQIVGGFDEKLLDEFDRVMRKINAYYFCSKEQLQMYFDHYAKHNVDLLVWHKTNPMPVCNNKYLSDIEYIFFVRQKGVKMYNTMQTSAKVFEEPINATDKKIYHHPTIKPLPIVRTLIYNSSKQGDIVFDPFLGSGTTAVAAHQLGRQYIGAEINAQYFNIAQLRINAEKAQQKLNI